MKAFMLLAAGAAMLIGAGAAGAQTTVYRGADLNTSSGLAAASNPNSSAASAQFNGALVNGVRTESFENFATGSSAPLVLSFTGGSGQTLNATLTGSGDVASATRGNPTGSGQFAIDGSNYYEVSSSNFGITFSSPVAAFGFFTTDIESDLQVVLNHAVGNETYSFADLFGTSTSTPSGSVNFLGLINAANPFVSVAFGPGANSNGDIFAFDQLTIGDAAQVLPPTGSVPEPASWGMMILGMGAVGFALRRRSAPARTTATV